MARRAALAPSSCVPSTKNAAGAFLVCSTSSRLAVLRQPSGKLPLLCTRHDLQAHQTGYVHISWAIVKRKQVMLVMNALRRVVEMVGLAHATILRTTATRFIAIANAVTTQDQRCRKFQSAISTTCLAPARVWACHVASTHQRGVGQHT